LQMTSRRAIPAVGKVLDALDATSLPHALVTQVARQYLTSLRRGGDVPPFQEIIEDLRRAVARLAQSRLQRLINGTGIIIHTNFGRAPLSAAAIRALTEIGSFYNNLEYDLSSGTRGSRAGYLERALALLCGTESATVVNNCAAALVLLVRHFTKKKKEVIISRGELLQIGGGFRIGEILQASGAHLREVGATNKTTLDDYACAISSETAFILRVHQSNFFMSGFADAPPNEEIAKLARSRRMPFVVDLGSGALVATEKLGLVEHEPTPAETLKHGADLVCFSGDKLCGGPQAGIIAGKSRLVTALKREPLFRALRCDKLIFAALEATVDAHLRKDWVEIPVLALLQTSIEDLRARADAFVRQLSPLKLGIVETKGELGGGTLPRSVFRSIALEIGSEIFSPNEIATRLRKATPAVIGYIVKDRFRLDLRTIFPRQDDLLAQSLRACLTNSL
ncbi:MAG: L-seryl-tRNA(Sec) selenium transferase, partial [Chthoniobacterales bacterium]